MKHGIAQLLIACLLVLSAGLGASAQSCPGVTFSSVTAINRNYPGSSLVVDGIVVISTPGITIPLDQVLVQGYNGPRPAPFTTKANCGTTSAAGTTTCTYELVMPFTPSPEPVPPKPFVQAIATVAGSNANCFSAHTFVQNVYTAAANTASP